MLLNASQPFLPGGWRGGGGGVGKDSGGGGRQEGWWKRSAQGEWRGDETCREGVVDHLCVEGYSGGHSPDHQISFHSGIPAQPQTHTARYVYVYTCVSV